MSQRRSQLRELMPLALDAVDAWQEPGPGHPALEIDPARFESAWAEFSERMAGNYPFHHPRYAGQMLKPPHPVAIAAYTAAINVNTNNHALDGGPATSEMEKEVVRDLAAMFGLPGAALGHLTASGTIANLEALWIARSLHPGKAVVHGANAHYTHSRMCGVLGIEALEAPADAAGRLDLDAVDALCRRHDVGTVVVTAGTTGTGTVDRIEQALELRERHGVRIHVDAAYGGFFALLGDELLDTAPFRAIAACDKFSDRYNRRISAQSSTVITLQSKGAHFSTGITCSLFDRNLLTLGMVSTECPWP